jgi:hypothetical protein
LLTKKYIFLYRPTATQAMEHPYFKQYHDPNDEPIAEGHIEVDIEQDLSIGGYSILLAY